MLGPRLTEFAILFAARRWTNNRKWNEHSRRALSKFSEPGVVEVASIQRYDAYLAMVMNASRVGVQANAKPLLEKFPL